MANGNDMLGAPPINTFPPGFLSLFNLKNGGRSPQVLSTQLAPVFEMSKLYLYSVSEIYRITNSVAYPALTQGWSSLDTVLPKPLPLVAGVITVPQNEVWILLETSAMNFRVAVPGTDTVDWMVSFRTQNAFSVHTPSQTNMGVKVGIANVPTAQHYAIDQPEIMTAGMGLGVFLSGISTPTNPVVHIRLVRLTV